MLWSGLEVELWDYVDKPGRWSTDDKLELEVTSAYATYRRNGGDWWAVYKGASRLFHGATPVTIGSIPGLRSARPAIYRRQVRPDLRELIVADAWAEGEAAVVQLLLETVDAVAQFQTHRGVYDTQWEGAYAKLARSGKAEVDAAILKRYRDGPSPYVVWRASQYLELGTPEMTEANRGALRALQRAADKPDGRGGEHAARYLLTKLACSDDFAEERSDVSVSCP